MTWHRAAVWLDRRPSVRTGTRRTMTAMCPHCGTTFAGWMDLTPRHSTVVDAFSGQPSLTVCPGSQQNPRNAESDARTLWNGTPNRRFAG